MSTRTPFHLLMLAAFWLTGLINSAASHEIRPAIATVSFPSNDLIEIEISANLEALISDIGAEHADTSDSPNAKAYDRLRSLDGVILADKFRSFYASRSQGVSVTADGKQLALGIKGLSVPDVGNLALARISVLILQGRLPPNAKSFSWTYDAGFGSSVLRHRDVSGRIVPVGWLKDGKSSGPIPIAGSLPKTTLQIFAEYVVLGFTHIVPKGLDHILFVLGLYFLSPQFRPLVQQVSAFTLAHSITLAMGLYGVISAPSSLVEPLIAASIVFIALENLFSSRVSRWRTSVVFGFGLLHGLGFAGVLQEIGLPASDYALGLVAFNVGVECGQLAVIGLAWLASGFWFSGATWYRHRIAMPASFVIAAIGLYWTAERVLGSVN